jgi:ribosome assembly protein 3
VATMREEKTPAGVQTSSSSSSSSESSSDAESSAEDNEDVEMKPPEKKGRRPPSRSPSPADDSLPMSIPLHPTTEQEKVKDAQMKERFRKYWMKSMAEGFGDELQQLQKVCL